MPGAESIPDAEVNKIIRTTEVIDRDTYPETTTHLRIAATMGRLDDVINLLKRGADPNVEGEFCRSTALLDAIRCYSPQSPEIVRLLLEHGAKMDARDTYNDCTAIDFAVQGHHVEVARLLLDKGAKPTFRKLHATQGIADPVLDDLIRLLVERGGNVNEVGVWNRTPVMWAALRGSVEVVKLLISRGADVNYVAVFNKIPETALNLAQKAGRAEVVKLLMEAGAKKLR